MTLGEFLIRLNVTNKVSTASKRKPEGVHSGKRSERVLIQKTTDTIRSEFIQDALSYIQHLIGEILRQTGLSSDIIKELAAFDPYIMLRRLTKVALRHFDVLFSTFQRRSWIGASSESLCRDQYIGLLDHLRANYPASLVITDVAEDLIDFLKKLEFLQPENISFTFSN